MAAALLGSVKPVLGGHRNIIVRMFTPGTHTEVLKSCCPTSTVAVHVADDGVNIVTSAAATDQATLNTLLNEIKADYNAHRVSLTFHTIADTVNAVTSADASSLATSITLANEIKADYNAHRSQSGVHPYTDGARGVMNADATDLATCITLANEEKAVYNLHRTNTTEMFTIYGVTPGTYDVGIKADICISRKVTDVVFTEGVTTYAAFGMLFTGDASDNDMLSASDATLVNQEYYGTIGEGSTNGQFSGYGGDWLMPTCS